MWRGEEREESREESELKEWEKKEREAEVLEEVLKGCVRCERKEGREVEGGRRKREGWRWEGSFRAREEEKVSGEMRCMALPGTRSMMAGVPGMLCMMQRKGGRREGLCLHLQ